MASLGYRPEIDGLRAIAVAAVVLYHADAGLLPGGFVGVDVFFVISGYLITSLLAAEWRDTGRIDLAGFYVRRVRRLLPALCVVVAAVLVMSVLVLGPLGSPLYRVIDSALASLAFLANFYFQATSGGYFDGPSDGLPLLHLWSLAVEEQYYLVYPVLLWALMARAGNRTVAVLAALSLASLALAEYWLRVDAAMAFYQMPARFWELAAGGIVAFLGRGRLGSHLPAWIAALGTLLVVGACVWTSKSGHFPGLGALPAVLGASLVLWAVHDAKELGIAGRMLRSRPFVAVGLLSYSLYLWHWPLLALDRAVTLDPSPIAWRLALCALALGLAWLSWRWVETPVRRMRPLPARRVFFAAAVTGVLLAAIGVATASMNFQSSDVTALAERTRSDRPGNMSRCHFAKTTKVAALPADDCGSQPGMVPRVAIWGDSHALAWQPFAWGLAQSRGQSAIGFTMDACLPASGRLEPHAEKLGPVANCAGFNALAADRMAAGGFDTVVVAARWLAWFPAGDGARPTGEDAAASPALAADQIEAALDKLRGVPEVILIAPVPVLRHDASRCILMLRLDDCAIARSDFDRAAVPSRRLLAQLASKHPNVTLVDPADYFCGDTTCPVLKDGRSLFWDDDHVASSAARAFTAAYLANPSRYTSTMAEPVGSATLLERP